MTAPIRARFAAPELGSASSRALVVGAIGLVLCGIGAVASPRQFLFSYLAAFMLWLGITLGCLAIVMIHHLSGGAWGLVVRRLLEAGTRTLPLMALAFIPIALGVQVLYPWARPEAAADAILREKALYLNVPFFLARAAVYLVIWGVIAYWLNRWSLEQDRTSDPRLPRRLQLLSAGGIVVYALTITFASIDWVMSLEPHWFSTIFGVLFMGGQGLSALAFTIAVAVLLSSRPPLLHVITAAHLHDLGKLLLAFVMLWAYFSFSQFLIIWSGNVVEEIPWYVHRLGHGWQWVGLALVLFHFAVPFALLLSRDFKRNPRMLAGLALVIVFMRLVDLFWMIGPEANGDVFRVHWLDLAAPFAIGGLWIALYLRQLSTRPLMPTGDPDLAGAFEHTGAH
jgi:hypothetical protein